MSKLRVGLLFGGRSVEHEVSVASATSILSALDPARYEVRLLAIDSDGRWHVVDEMIGFPAGNTKTIVCDLAGKLPSDAKRPNGQPLRLRLSTSFEVRWDHIALYHTVPAGTATVAELEPALADLQWHGFAELRPHAADQVALRLDARPVDHPRCDGDERQSPAHRHARHLSRAHFRALIGVGLERP